MQLHHFLRCNAVIRHCVHGTLLSSLFCRAGTHRLSHRNLQNTYAGILQKYRSNLWQVPYILSIMQTLYWTVFYYIKTPQATEEQWHVVRRRPRKKKNTLKVVSPELPRLRPTSTKATVRPPVTKLSATAEPVQEQRGKIVLSKCTVLWIMCVLLYKLAYIGYIVDWQIIPPLLDLVLGMSQSGIVAAKSSPSLPRSPSKRETVRINILHWI